MEDKKCCTTVNHYYGCCGNGTGGGAVEQSWENYSFDEIAIGTWVDGKTIYRKVIEGTLATSNGTGKIFADVSDLEIDRMVNLSGTFVNSLGNAQYAMSISYNMTQSVSGSLFLYYHNVLKEIRYNFADNEKYFSGCTAYVFIEYTKQGDEPTTD